MDNLLKIHECIMKLTEGMNALALAHVKPPTVEAETIRKVVEMNGHKQVMDQLFNLAEVFQQIKKEYGTQFSNTFIEVPMDASTQQRSGDPGKFPVQAGWGVFLSDTKKAEELRLWALENIIPIISLLAKGVSPLCNEYYHNLYKIENCISNAIRSCYPREWEENHISYTWLKKLRETCYYIQLSGNPNFTVSWDAFKVKDRSLENKHGDIAFLVRVSFPNGNFIDGVAFMEAKRIYEDGKYQALKWPQLIFQSSSLSNHRLVLYDFECSREVNALIKEFYFAEMHGYSVTTEHAIRLKTKDRSLHKISYPLSYQIFSRYFHGLDLDYTTEVVNAVKDGAAGDVQFLVVAHASLGSQGDLSIQGILGKSEEYQSL